MPNLSESEARAEAVAIVVRVMLGRIGENEYLALAQEAQVEAADAGVPAILEELDWLLSVRELD